MKQITKHRRGTADEWAKYNGIPEEGEILVEFGDDGLDHKLKIGDGEHTYSQLSYLQSSNGKTQVRMVIWEENDDGSISR